MPIDVPTALAESRRGFVVAAAGCGKTEAIAAAISRNSSGRQLVLTHTHAGVKALRDRLHRFGVKSQDAQVDTIAGWALSYAASYPILSGLSDAKPTGPSWNEVYGAALRTLQSAAIRDVVSRSYSGCYVDEYQDCTKTHHQLVMAIAEILPCRILGDPLQGIFGFKEPLVEWSTDVEPHFERLPDLETPWRWSKSNPGLGQRIQEVREALLNGEAIDLSALAPIVWRKKTPDEQRRACLGVAGSPGSAVAIQKWASNCHEIAQKLRGTFTSMEEMDCRDLMTAARRFERASGPKRAAHAIGFASTCMTVVGTKLKTLREGLSKGGVPTPGRASKYPEIVKALATVASEDSLAPLLVALRAIGKMPGRVLYRRELWSEMDRALRIQQASSDKTLEEAAWEARNRARRLGRRVERRTVSRTLLVKGLEFDHAIVLDADALDEKELYVAMSRGSHSLAVLSRSPRLKRSKVSL